MIILKNILPVCLLIKCIYVLCYNLLCTEFVKYNRQIGSNAQIIIYNIEVYILIYQRDLFLVR